MNKFLMNVTALLTVAAMYFVVAWLGGLVFGPLFGWFSEGQTDQVAYLKTMSGAMFGLFVFQYGLTKLFTFLIRLTVDNATKK